MRISPLAVAVHEAGHAIAQLSNPPQPEIRSVSIVDLDPGLLGLVDTDAMWQPHMATADTEPAVIEVWRGLAWKDAIFFLAGPVAELRWRRYSRIAIGLGAKQFAEECLGIPAPEGRSDFGRVRARIGLIPARSEMPSAKHGSKPKRSSLDTGARLLRLGGF